MTDFQMLAGLGQIADDYDALFCDIWGVIHNGREPFLAACEALERFRAERGPVILISNSPRPSVAIPEQFRQVGVPGELWDAIVTSGDATIDELARRAPGPAFKLGPDRDDSIYENLDMNFADLSDAAFISCTGLFDDENETPDDYTDLLGEALELGLPLVCANPDVRAKRGNKIIYCGGALAESYEKMGGEVIYAGKPHAPIYRLSRAWLEEVVGYVPPPERILAIGDNIFTDLRGAQNEGLDCLFVADGLYADTAEKLKTLLLENGITARYMSRALSW
ncbi:MAG: TIGR01459 family HAD-type hydrolase [Alphaproteobacteria bacterium]